MTIRAAVLREVVNRRTDRQTDRQTDRERQRERRQTTFADNMDQRTFKFVLNYSYSK